MSRTVRLCSVVCLTALVAGKSFAKSGCGSDAPSNGKHTVQVQDPKIGSIARTYRVYAPKNYDSFEATAIVIDFHGYSGSGQNQEEESGIKRIADENNFIAVFPTGLDDTVVSGQDAYSWNAVGTVSSPGPNGDTCKWNAQDTWNGYACHSSCRPTHGCINNNRASGCDCSTCADDILFVTKMLDKLEAEYCVATKRVFLTGLSNGAMMTYALATGPKSVAKRFAAIAPVAGSPLLGFGVAPPVGMPIMEIHGSKDNIIPANTSGSWRGEVGPDGSTVSSDGYYYEPVDRTLSHFADSNRCNGASRHYPTRFDGETHLYCMTTYGSCANGLVVRCTHSLGHTWPFGSGKKNREDFARLVWEFFTFAAAVMEKNTNNNTTRPVVM